MQADFIDGKPLAQRFSQVRPSGIRAIYNQALALEAQGERVIHLEMGEPDFDTPAHIKQAAQEALARGMVHYAPTSGIPELRSAIADKYGAHGLRVDPAQVLVTSGASEAISHALHAVLNADDEVVVLTPGWVNYLEVPRLLGVRSHCVPLREANRFHPDLDEIGAVLAPRTRLLILNSPHNPTGATLNRTELENLARFACRHNLLVLSDEIYEYIRYDGAAPIPLATFPGMQERTITISGVSKTYSMTGWRIGWAVAPPAIIEAMTRGRQYSTGSGPGFTQVGAVAGLRGSQDCVQAMVAEFVRRRQFFVKGLNQIPGFRCLEPEGAFYVFVNIQALGRTAEEMAPLLLLHAKVACVPGGAFGPGGEGYLRLSFAAAYHELEEAIDRIAKAGMVFGPPQR